MYTEIQKSKIKECLKGISLIRLENEFSAALDAKYPLIVIYGYSYELGDTFRKIDPIAFKEEFYKHLEFRMMRDLTEIDGIYYKKEEINSLFESGDV